MQNFEQYESVQPSIETAFNNVFKTDPKGDSSKGIAFPLAELEEELTNIVDSFANTSKLNLNKGNPRIKDDKIHEIIGIENNFKHKTDVTCVLCLKNGMIVSGSSDTNIRVWDPKTGKCIRVLEGHTHTVLCIIELESGFLASGSLDQTAIVWNPNNGKIISIMEGFQNPIIGMIELDQKQLIINFNEPMVMIWVWNTLAKVASNVRTIPLKDANLSFVIKQNKGLLL